MAATEPGSEKKLFPAISAHAFEHPLDRSALLGLQKVPGLDWLIKTFVAVVGEKRLRLFFLASAVRVNERQFPRIHSAYQEACRILDVQDPPELFVTQRMSVNAAAIGMGKPFIIVTSPLVDMLSDAELQCVLGHELGHVLCGHALYTTLLLILVNAWYAFTGIPGGMLAILFIRLALLEWSRKAELTADRAGLLVSQDAGTSYRVDMKLAGGPKGDQMDVEEFFKQSEEYQQGGDLLDGVLKIALLLGQTHPMPVLRVAELRKWVDSGEYQRILAGTYLKRGEAAEKGFVDSVKDTAAAYKDTFHAARDPLMAAIKDLSNGAAAAGGEILDFFKRATHIGEQKMRDHDAPDDDPDDHGGPFRPKR